MLAFSVLYIVSNGINTTDIYGVMVTRSDHWVMTTWLKNYASAFRQLAVLDGTMSLSQREIVKASTLFYPNVIYAHESQFGNITHKTDNGLRGIAFSMLDQEKVIGMWVVIAHPDEFYPQTFLDLAKKADEKKFNVIPFKVWYAVPYIDDKARLEEGICLGPKTFNILQRVRYCFPTQLYKHVEARMYKHISKDVKWGTIHQHVIPETFPGKKDATFQGHYVHYKIHSFATKDIDEKTGVFTNSIWAKINTHELRNLTSDKKIGLYSFLKSGDGVTCASLVKKFCCSKPFIPCNDKLMSMYGLWINAYE
jgi:hypothetical protein